MVSPSGHLVRLEIAKPRGTAAVRATLPMAEVPRRFAEYLDQVYAASRDGGIRLDGQNIFLYGPDAGPGGATEVTFGVGVTAPFAPLGLVRYTALPTGPVATTTHWGDYTGLREAHAAVIAWTRAQGHALAGPRWEVYGHWSDDPARRRTDIHYLLGSVPGT